MRPRHSISVSTPPRLVALRSEPHAVLAAPCGRPVSELERQHATAARGHLALRERMVGVVVAGRGNAPRARPGARPGAAPALAAVSTWRGSRTCSVRRPRRSSHAGSGASTPPIVRRVHSRRARSSGSRVVTDAGEHVGVPGQVLGRALPGEVGAEVERALQKRRRERVVAAQQRAARMGVARGLLDVHQRQQRIGRCFDDRERRAVAGAAEVARRSYRRTSTPKRSRICVAKPSRL